MIFLRKILSVLLSFSLLLAVTGFNKEKHFCLDCNKEYEKAWLFYSFSEKDNHDCHCSHSHDSKCNGSCEVSSNGHVEHINSDVNVYISQKSINDISPKIISLERVNLVFGSQMIAQNNHVINSEPKPPDKTPIHIANCNFLL